MVGIFSKVINTMNKLKKEENIVSISGFFWENFGTWTPKKKGPLKSFMAFFNKKMA